jgi:2'-5' RNA ligase superfamily
MPYAVELALDPESAAAVRRAWRELVRLTLASVGLFPGVAVFLAPTVTADLLGLHAGFHRRFARLGQGSWDHYRPGTWVPHCTLVTDMEPDQFAGALAIAARVPRPLECRLVEVGIVEFRPLKQVLSHALVGR